MLLLFCCLLLLNQFNDISTVSSILQSIINSQTVQQQQQAEDRHAGPDVEWNFTKWWHERSQLPHVQSEPVVFEEPNKDLLQQYSNFDEMNNFENCKNETTNTHQIVIDKNSPNILKPTTTIERINQTIFEFFSRPRNWNDDKEYLKELRESLKERFLSYGLKTAFHIFKNEDKSPYYQTSQPRQTAANVIAILPGPYRGTPDDVIVLVGAHYDTVKKSPGVDDNGSGSSAVLEIARLLTTHRCKLNKTVIFALFDLEEEYLKGSKYFVHQYLIPSEMVKNKAKFFGAYIMDMLLAYNNTNGSQSIRDFWPTLPVFVDEVKCEGSRGNFLTAWSRRNIDQDLYFYLEKNWRNPYFPLRLMDPPLPPLSHEIAKDWNKYSKYGTFARSDHASFWYPLDREKTLNAILLSDLGPWRRDMMYHYHRTGDDTRWLNRDSLDFMKNTIDSMVGALIDLADGKCYIKKHFN